MKQHFSQIRDYFKSGYGEMVKITAAAFFILILLGYAAGTLFPSFTDDYVTRMLSLLSTLADENGMVSFEAILFNNISVCFTSALYGFIPFVYLSAYPLGSNAALLGLLAAYYEQNGLPLSQYILGILPHGITEIPAMIFTFALGLQLCRDFSQNLNSHKKLPDNPSSKKLILSLLRIYVTLILPLVIVSAALEVYVTPLVLAAAM